MERGNNKVLIMILLAVSIILLVIARESKADCDEIYLKIGSGYKFSETNSIQDDVTRAKLIINSDPISARIETGVECGNLTYGVSHHSQWRTGFPFNNEHELHKTEFFIDYKFSWGI